MEISKHHSKTQQRHEHRNIIQTHLTSLSDSKTLEKTLLPYITKKYLTHLHTTRLQKQPLHKPSTTNINNTIAAGFNQNRPAERILTVALDIKKTFDIVNIHLHMTQIFPFCVDIHR